MSIIQLQSIRFLIHVFSSLLLSLELHKSLIRFTSIVVFSRLKISSRLLHRESNIGTCRALYRHQQRQHIITISLTSPPSSLFIILISIQPTVTLKCSRLQSEDVTRMLCTNAHRWELRLQNRRWLWRRRNKVRQRELFRFLWDTEIKMNENQRPKTT